MKLFWKAMGGKNRREQIDKSITRKQWKEHFRSQYILGEGRMYRTEQERNEDGEDSQEEGEVNNE